MPCNITVQKVFIFAHLILLSSPKSLIHKAFQHWHNRWNRLQVAGYKFSGQSTIRILKTYKRKNYNHKNNLEREQDY